MAFVCRLLRSFGRLRPSITVFRPTMVRWAVGSSLLPTVAYCCNADTNNTIPTMVIDVDENLTPENPASISEIQEMFVQASNSAIELHRKTADALVQAENEYAKIAYKLIAFHSASVKSLAGGDSNNEERIWSMTVDTRLEMKAANEKRKKLMLVFTSTEKLLKHVSEVAFMAGDEEASSFAYQILCEMREEVEDAAGESKNAEKLLSESQVETIEETAKYLEENLTNREKDIFHENTE